MATQRAEWLRGYPHAAARDIPVNVPVSLRNSRRNIPVSLISARNLAEMRGVVPGGPS